MERSEIRDLIITGTFMIGEDGIKEPTDWKDYANKLEDHISNLVEARVMPKIVGVCKREIGYVRFCLNEQDYNEKFSIEDKAMLKERNKAYSQILQIVNNFSV